MLFLKDVAEHHIKSEAKMNFSRPASISSYCCIVTAAPWGCLGYWAMVWLPVVQNSGKLQTKELTIHLWSLLHANVNGHAPGTGFFLGTVLCPKNENCTSSANSVIQFPAQLDYSCVTASERIFYNSHQQRTVCPCLQWRQPGQWFKKQHRISGRQSGKGNGEKILGQQQSQIVA